MASVISVMAKLQADASNFVSGMKKAEKATDNLVATAKADGKKIQASMDKAGADSGKAFKGGFGKFVGPALFAGAIIGAVKFAGSLAKSAEAERKENALVENIATSMGLFGDKASSVAKRVTDYAQAQALATGIDETSIKAGQAKIMTFSEIAKSAGEVGGMFDRTTKAAMDLSSAGFGAMEGTSIQLGKALQDPIKGMGALSRSGVTFSATEKQAIKAMVASGDMLKAQDTLLKAVEMQVGGSAEATATGTARMKAGFDQVKEDLGAGLLPMLDKLSSFVADKVFPIISTFATKIGPIFDKIGPVIGGVFEHIGTIFTSVMDAMAPALETVGPLLAQLASSLSPFGVILQIVEPLIPQIFGALANIIVALMPAISAIVEGIGSLAGMLTEALKPILDGIIPILLTFATMLGDLIPPIIGILVPIIGILINTLVPIIQIVLMIVNVFMLLLKPLISIIKLFFVILKPVLVFIQALTRIGAVIMQILMPIIQSLIDFIEPAFNMIGTLADSLAGWITTAMDGIAGFITPILNGIIDGINAVLSFLGQKTIAKLPTGIVKDAKKQGEALGKAKAEGEKKAYLKNRKADAITGAVGAVQTKEVSAVSKKRNAVIKRLALAKDFAKKITENLLSGTDVTTLGGSSASIIDNLKNRITAMQEYGQKIADLKKMGASKGTIEQILASGVEQGSSTASSLLSGGKDAISQINALQTQATRTATGVGLVGEDAVFNRGQASAVANYDITINAGLGTNGSDVGKQIVTYIRSYERQNGKLWKPAT